MRRGRPITPNRIRRRPDGSVEILLKGGRVALIDHADLPAVTAVRWCLATPGRWGRRYAQAYPAGNPDQRAGRLVLSRFIMNPPDHQDVLHINRDGLDCRRRNLRVTDRGPIVHRCIKRPGSSSAYRGVSWDRAAGRWRANIRRHGQQFSLGRFDAEIDAARAYDRAARKLYGDLARLNLPEEAA